MAQMEKNMGNEMDTLVSLDGIHMGMWGFSACYPTERKLNGKASGRLIGDGYRNF